MSLMRTPDSLTFRLAHIDHFPVWGCRFSLLKTPEFTERPLGRTMRLFLCGIQYIIPEDP